MRKFLLVLALILLAHVATGCGLFGGSKTYDGSEQAYSMHPEWTDHTPGYMTGENSDADNK